MGWGSKLLISLIASFLARTTKVLTFAYRERRSELTSGSNVREDVLESLPMSSVGTMTSLVLNGAEKATFGPVTKTARLETL